MFEVGFYCKKLTGSFAALGVCRRQRVRRPRFCYWTRRAPTIRCAPVSRAVPRYRNCSQTIYR